MHPKTVCPQRGQRLQSSSSFRQQDQSDCIQWIAWRVSGSAPRCYQFNPAYAAGRGPAMSAGGGSHGRRAASVRAARSAAW
eukprot:4503532-Pleurochrysis_carterae.AAC.1